MNIEWTYVAGFGPTAWNHGDQPLKVNFGHHQEQNPVLIFHQHQDARTRHRNHHLADPISKDESLR